MAAQDIAEPNRREEGAVSSGIFCQGLNVNLTDPFGWTHHVGGVARFIRRDKNKSLDFLSERHLNQTMSADNVTEQSFSWIIFHHRYMFVGGGMKNNLRLVFRKGFVQGFAIFYVSEERSLPRN